MSVILYIFCIVVVFVPTLALFRQLVILPRRARRKAANELIRKEEDQIRIRQSQDEAAKRKALATEFETLLSAAYGGDEAASERLRGESLQDDFAELIAIRESHYRNITHVTVYPYRDMLSRWFELQTQEADLVELRDQIIAASDLNVLVKLVSKLQLILYGKNIPAPKNYCDRLGLDVAGLLKTRVLVLLEQDGSQMDHDEALFRRYHTVVQWHYRIDASYDLSYGMQHEVQKVSSAVLQAIGDNINLYNRAVATLIVTPRYHDFYWTLDQYRSGELRRWAAEALCDENFVAAQQVLAYIDRFQAERDEVRELAAELAKMVARIRAGLQMPLVSPADPSSEG